MKHIKQKTGYPELQIDISEPDTVQIWAMYKDSSEVVHIEKESLAEVIEILTLELKKEG